MSRELLKRATEKDARFAEAWMMLAANCSLSVLENYRAPKDGWPEVDRCLIQAAKLKPGLVNLHFVRATKTFFGEWKWAEALREWRIAESVPNRELLPESFADDAMAAWALGNIQRALQLIGRARSIDPFNQMLLLHESSYLLYAGRKDEAAVRCQTVIDTHPLPGDESAAYFMLAEVRRAQGRFADAIAARRKAHALRDDSDDELDDVLASAVGEEGYQHIERTAVDRLELRTLKRRQRLAYASPIDFARAYAQLGDNDQAFEYLHQALDERSPALVFLRVDRAWEAIRSDPRFAGVVKQVGLPS
jgi:tetratricopeptide (TPR) repeat protein